MPSTAALWMAWSRRLANPPAGPLPPITFPTTPLTVKVEVAIGADVTALPATWGWADATGVIYTRDPITITRGREDQASTADTSTLSLTANNRDGRWSTRNPNGAWYGQLRKGTPIRVSAGGYPRYSGFLSALPPRWDVSGEDRYVPLAAKGLFYRLTQGASPQRSALRRTITGADTAVAPHAYWPLEDPPDTPAARSGLAGGTVVMTGGGTGVVFGDAGPAGSASAVDFSAGGKLTGLLSGVDSDAWVICFAGRSDDVSSTEAFCSIWLGAGAAWSVVCVRPQGVSPFGPSVYAMRPDGTIDSSSQLRPADADGWHWYALVGSNDGGGNAVLTLYVDGVFDGSNGLIDTAGVMAAPTKIMTNTATPGLAFTTLPGAICHLAVFSGTSTPPDYSDAVAGYVGEAAHTRFLRLGAEENIPASAIVAEDRSVLMGPQPVESILPLLRECEAADQAYLYEGLNFDLIFQGHTGRENLVAALALDYTVDGHVAPPLEPTDDDQDARNDVEVNRDGGSSSQLTEDDPNVELSIPNIGRRDESVTYSLHSDDQTVDLAGWRLHMGTWPGYRFPVLSLNLAAGPSLIPAFVTAGLGFLATIDNPPDDIGPDQIAVIVEGYTEILGQFDWDVAANCSLNGPWHVFTTAEDAGDIGEFLGYLIPDTCVTCEALDTTETEILFFSEPRFSVDSDDWTPPAAMVIGGETLALSAVAYAATDSFTRSVVDGLGDLTSGQTWLLSGTAADHDVGGTTATIQPTTTGSDYLAYFDVGHPDMDLQVTFSLNTLPASGTFLFGLNARLSNSSNYYYCPIELTSAGAVTLRFRKRVNGSTSVLATRVIQSATAGTQYKVRFAVVGTTLSVKMWPAAKNEPEWWLLTDDDTSLDGVAAGGTSGGLWCRNDTAATTHVLTIDDFVVLRPQLATVARSQNTIVKSHTSGAELAFLHPGVLGL